MKLTTPVGVMTVPGEASVTVAVQVVCWFTTTVAGVHPTAVVVLRLFTVRVKVATSSAGVVPEGLPVMVMVYVPGAAVEAMLTVMVDEAVGVIGLGLKEAVTPVDGPDMVADRVTAVAVPEFRVAVTVAVVVTAVAPIVTVALVGLTARL